MNGIIWGIKVYMYKSLSNIVFYTRGWQLIVHTKFHVNRKKLVGHNKINNVINETSLC